MWDIKLFIIICLVFALPTLSQAAEGDERHEEQTGSQEDSEAPPDEPEVHLIIPREGRAGGGTGTGTIECEKEDTKTGKIVPVTFRLTYTDTKIEVVSDSSRTTTDTSLRHQTGHARDNITLTRTEERDENERSGSGTIENRTVAELDSDNITLTDNTEKKLTKDNIHTDSKAVLEMLETIGYSNCGFGKEEGPSKRPCCNKPPELCFDSPYPPCNP